MSTNFIFSFRNLWLIAAVGSISVAITLPVPAASHSYQLPDGTTVTMNRQSGQCLLQLSGRPFFAYTVAASENLLSWVTLETNAMLNAAGAFTCNDTRNLSKCFYRVLPLVPPTTNTFTSIAAEDGRVTEFPETSNTGGFAFATDATSSALRAGDYDFDFQHKSFLSFDTSAIPDGATILSATLKLRRGTVVGTNPFITHGACYIDVKGGSGFGGTNTLATTDFQASADATQAGTLSNALNDGDWSTGSLNAAGLSFVNKTGRTQFRVYFALDDNDDDAGDYIGWYSADHATPANRPVLEIIYR